MILGGFVARTLCNLIGYAYPMYKSVHAVQTESDDANTQWVMYWAVAACFSMVEIVGDVLIAWFPFYYEAKVIFFAWLVFPMPSSTGKRSKDQRRGASKLFEAYLKPYFIKYEKQIDQGIDHVRSRASEKLNEICRETAQVAVRKGSGFFMQSQQYMAQQSSSTSEPPSSVSSAVWSASTSIIAQLAKSASSIEEEESVRVISNVDTIMEDVQDEESSRSSKFMSMASEFMKEHSPRNKKKKMDLKAESKEMEVVKEETFAYKHSDEDDSQILLTQFKMLMVRGIQVKKYGQRTGPRPRTLSIDPECQFVKWESSSGPNLRERKIDIIDLQHIRAGNDSPGFERTGKSLATHGLPSAALCFYLISKHDVRLEIETQSRETRNLLVTGFQLLVEWRRRQEEK